MLEISFFPQSHHDLIEFSLLLILFLFWKWKLDFNFKSHFLAIVSYLEKRSVSPYLCAMNINLTSNENILPKGLGKCLEGLISQMIDWKHLFWSLLVLTPQKLESLTKFLSFRDNGLLLFLKDGISFHLNNEYLEI